MSSQNSPQKDSASVRFSAPEMVSTSFITRVLQDWEALLTGEQQDMQSLVIASNWKYLEALGMLLKCVLQNLGVEGQTLEAFSLIGADPDNSSWNTCELVLVWSAAAFLEPEDIVDDCVVTCVAPFPLPLQRLFVVRAAVRNETIARWASKLSAIADDLPEKET